MGLCRRGVGNRDLQRFELLELWEGSLPLQGEEGFAAFWGRGWEVALGAADRMTGFALGATEVGKAFQCATGGGMGFPAPGCC